MQTCRQRAKRYIKTSHVVKAAPQGRRMENVAAERKQGPIAEDGQKLAAKMRQRKQHGDVMNLMEHNCVIPSLACNRSVEAQKPGERARTAAAGHHYCIISADSADAHSSSQAWAERFAAFAAPAASAPLYRIGASGAAARWPLRPSCPRCMATASARLQCRPGRRPGTVAQASGRTTRTSCARQRLRSQLPAVVVWPGAPGSGRNETARCRMRQRVPSGPLRTCR